MGDAWGALYFTENFTDALVARMALGRQSDDETLDQSEVRVWLDMSSKYLLSKSFQKIFEIRLFILFVFRPTNWFDVEQRSTIVVQRLWARSVEELRSESKTRRYSDSS